MVVLARVPDMKLNFDALVKRVAVGCTVVRARLEAQPVQANAQSTVAEELVHATVLVRRTVPYDLKVPRLEHGQAHAQADRRLTQGGVEHV